MTPKELVIIAAQAAEEKKAERILLMDVTGKSDLCDFQLICSGQNEKQTQAISASIEATLKTRHNIRPMAVEGKQGGHWVLIDYGPVIIHIFHNYLRDYYGIESLWPGAQLFDFK